MAGAGFAGVAGAGFAGAAGAGFGDAGAGFAGAGAAGAGFAGAGVAGFGVGAGVGFAGAGFAGAVYAMAALVPPDLRWALTWVGSLASMMRWVPQAWTNFRNGHTGCLSSVTVALTVLGLAARTWTYRQNGDAPMVRACATSLALACVVLLQLVAYRGATRAHTWRGSRRRKKREDFFARTRWNHNNRP